MPDLYLRSNQISAGVAYAADPSLSITLTYSIVSHPTQIIAGTAFTVTVRDAATTPTALNTSIKFVDEFGPEATINSVTPLGGNVYEINATFTTSTNKKFNVTTGYFLHVTVDAESLTSAATTTYAPPAGQGFINIVNPLTAEGSVYENHTGSPPVTGQQVVHDTVTAIEGIAVDVLATGEIDLASRPTDTDNFDFYIIEADETVQATATYTLPNYPSGIITIGTITTTATTAAIPFSYSDTDADGFEYRLDGGAWIAATSPIALTGLTSEQTYLIEISALDGTYRSDIASANFTALTVVDSTPDPIADQTVNNQSLNAYAGFAAFTVTGVDAGEDIPVTVSGGLQYAVSTDGGQSFGGFTASPTNVRLNYQILPRILTPNAYSTPTPASGTITGSINVGGQTATFTAVTIADTAAPVISLIGGNQTITAGSIWSDPGATAADNSGEDLTGSITASGSVDPNTIGVYTITYSVTDSSGNTGTTTRTVTVVSADSVAPVISLIGGTVTLTEGDTYTEQGATATDNIDGDISGSIVISGTVDTSTPGTYSVRYNVTDSAGNAATEVVRTVIVEALPVDTTAPVISLIGGSQTVVQNTSWTELGFTASDDVDGDVTADVTVTGTVNISTPGIYTLTYSVTDTAGNTGTATRTVTVTPAVSVGQTIEITGGNTKVVAPNVRYTDPSVYATDADGDNVTSTAVWSGDTVDTATDLTSLVVLEHLTPDSTDSAARTATFISNTVLPKGSFKMRGRYKVNGVGEWREFTAKVRTIS